MTLIRVNPESVHRYGREAQSIFDSMHQLLERLVSDVVAVRYYGPNALAFKNQCGDIASAFANALHLDMNAMANAVRVSTSNIAAALGGTPISIQVNGRAISKPAPEVVDYVDVDTAALEAAVPVVALSFDQLRKLLDINLARLADTDWEGNAKLQATTAVEGFTSHARSKCTNAEQELSQFMNRQVQAVVAADK